MAGDARRLSGMRVGLALLVVALGAAWWWVRLPRTPEELFRARCSTCHELRLAEVCAIPSAERPGVVATMRSLHGADEVIDERDARLITRHLREGLSCP